MKVLYVPANIAEPMEVREIEPTLDGMKALVGGWLEVVGLTNPVGTLYLDEEGKLKRLPFNQRATAIAQQRNAMFLDFIAGDAFISGPPDREGNETECPAEYLELAD